MKQTKFVEDCRSALPGATIRSGTRRWFLGGLAPTRRVGLQCVRIEATAFLSCLLLAAVFASPTRADIQPTEEGSSTATVSELVLTNVAQLADEFSQNSPFYLPWTSWEWWLYGDGQPRWADLTQFPKEFSVPDNVTLPETRDVKLLPLTLTRDVLTGLTIVKAEWSGQEIARIAPPADYQPGKSQPEAGVLKEWQQWKDYAKEWEEWEGEIPSPILVTRIQLADINEKPLFDANLAAEELAWEQAQAKDAEAQAERLALQEKEGGAMMLLMGGGPCSITNETEAFEIVSIEQTADVITLQFESCSDHLYQIESVSTLELSTQTVWTLEATVIGEDGMTAWDDPNAGGLEQKFWRVKRLSSDGDFDGDGMPNGWELAHGLNPLVNDASADSDGDGLSNLEEYQAGTEPLSSDSDSDAIPDGWEVAHGLNPIDGNDAGLDPDGDGFSNVQEYLNGTDPHLYNDPFDIIVNRGEPYTASLTVRVQPLSTNFPRILVSLDPSLTNATVFTNSGAAFDYTLPDNGDGQYTLSLQYADAANQPTNNLVIKTVMLDRVSPVVGIVAPASNAVLDQAFITLRAVAADPDPIEPTAARPLKIWLNDEPFWSRDGTNIVFERFPVPAGTNSFTVTVRAADEAGHTNQASRTWTVDPSDDTVAPHVTNFNIATTTLLPDVSAVWLECTADDGNAIIQAIVNADGSEETTNALNVRGLHVEGLVPLEFGTNTVAVRASDAAGNATSNVFTIIRSDRYRFAITNPVFGAFADAPSNYVSGYVSAKFDEGLPTETNVTTVLINGVEAVLSTNIDADGNLSFTTTNAIPLSVPITGFLAGPGIPTNPPPDPPTLSQEYEVVAKTQVEETFHCDGEVCGAWRSGSWWCLGEVGNCVSSNAFDLTVSGGLVSVDVYTRWRREIYDVCSVDPANDPSIWRPWSEFTYSDSFQDTPRSLSFGTPSYAGTGCGYGENGWTYARHNNGVEWLWPWRSRTLASITFKAPRQYDPNTTVIFTFEGMDYARPEGVALDLSQVKYQGRSPIAWSNEVKSVSYLITVDGGRAYTISQDSFQWPSFTTNSTWQSSSWTSHHSETLHHLSWTNFHNQTEPMEVITGKYNNNDWAAVWCKLNLGAGNVSARNETVFKQPRTKIAPYVTQSVPAAGNKGVRYSAAINGNFFFYQSGDTSCSSIEGFVGTGSSPWTCGNSTKLLGGDGGNRWGFGITTNGPQHVIAHDVEDANGYYPADTVKQNPFGMNNVGRLFNNGVSQYDPSWPDYNGSNARSLLVWSKDGKHLFMVMIGYKSGTGVSWSDTVNFVKTTFKAAVAKKLREFDIGDAVMLDGGTSTQLSFRRVEGDPAHGGKVTQTDFKDEHYFGAILKPVPTLVHTYATIPQN